MEMHIKKELLISGNNIIVDFEILPEIRQLMSDYGIDILKIINNTKWDVLLFEEFIAKNIDISSIKKIRLVINGISNNKDGKSITVPIEQISNEKPIAEVVDSGVVLSGFTIHYIIFNES